MTVPLCIRQGSKSNDDSVSVDELDWSAESQVYQLNTSGVALKISVKNNGSSLLKIKDPNFRFSKEPLSEQFSK